MNAEEIRRLRARKGWSQRQLAAAMKVEPSTIAGWEAGEMFPTRKHLAALRQLEQQADAQRSSGDRVHELLADPGFWRIVRKLLAHRELKDKVEKLADGWPDPLEG